MKDHFSIIMNINLMLFQILKEFSMLMLST